MSDKLKISNLKASTKDGKEILVCTVGKTVLHYDARILDDLHAMLKKFPLMHSSVFGVGSCCKTCLQAIFTAEDRTSVQGCCHAWCESFAQQAFWTNQ